MTENFKAAMAFVRAWEGGWSNDRLDPGGLTKWGVTIKTVIAKALDFNRDGRVNEADLSAMTEAQAEALYRSDYWDACRCDDLPPALALLVFDCAVNQGPGRAVRFLQSVVGAAEDGKIGPETIRRAQARFASDGRFVLRDFQVKRALHYSSLSTFARFGLGWFRRLMDGTIEAAHMVPPPASASAAAMPDLIRGLWDTAAKADAILKILDECRLDLSGLYVDLTGAAEKMADGGHE